MCLVKHNNEESVTRKDNQRPHPRALAINCTHLPSIFVIQCADFVNNQRNSTSKKATTTTTRQLLTNLSQTCYSNLLYYLLLCVGEPETNQTVSREETTLNTLLYKVEHSTHSINVQCSISLLDRQTDQ